MHCADRRLLALLLLALLGTSCTQPSLRRPAPTSPNVLLITVDMVRPDRLGCYGGKNATTPAMDGLAQRGVRFTHAYSQSDWTPGSHFSLLNGRFLGNLATVGAVPGTSLARSLLDHGYDTLAVVSSNILDPLIRLYTTQATMNSGFREYWPANGQPGGKLMAYRRAGRETVEVAEEWLRQRDSSKPFFLWVHLFDAHWPMVYPGANADGDSIWWFWQEAAMRRYALGVAEDDSCVGRLLRAVDLSQTYVVLAADHGEMLGEHEMIFQHTGLYDEVLHVPLIVAGPHLPASQIKEDSVMLVDIYPTVMHLLGFALPEHLDGVSLFGTPDRHRPMAADTTLGQAHMVRQDGWKLINYDLDLDESVDGQLAAWKDKTPAWARGPKIDEGRAVYRHKDTVELYHVAEDPGEKINVASRHVKERKQLFALMNRMLVGASGQNMENLRKRMRAQGY